MTKTRKFAITRARLRSVTHSITYWLIFLLVILLALALFAFLLECLAGGAKTETPGFQLAIISGILGGFVLTTASGNLTDSQHQVDQLRRIGTSFLGSAVCFVVFELSLVAMESQFHLLPVSVWRVVFQVSVGVGVLLFALGIGWVIWVLPSLWRGR